MYTNTRTKIIELIKDKGEQSPHQLSAQLGIGKVALHRQLNKLQQTGEIKKIGKSPKVFYTINQGNDYEFVVMDANREIPDDDFMLITPDGRFFEGSEALARWCAQRNFNYNEKIKEFIDVKKEYDSYKNSNGFIDGTAKIKSTFKQMYLDKVLYLSFYSWERFGKTPLGTLVLYAKQSQSRVLMNKLIVKIQQDVLELIKSEKIDAIAFIPPSEKREVQLMKELKVLNHGLPEVDIQKIITPIIVPQKSLSKLWEREENAQSTFAVRESRTFQNVLIIDDAIGSGATMNAIARKLREKKLVKGKIIGLAITGSFKGFDVISRV